jgi:hypothetical protein
LGHEQIGTTTTRKYDVIVPVKRRRTAALLWSACLSSSLCCAQDLSPRAYIITPIHSNAVVLTYSFYDGSVLFNGTLPITNSVGRINVPVFSYFHTMNLFGRSASFTGSLPYGIGTFQGDVVGMHAVAYRSGLLDSTFRFSVNLKGGPAMNVQQFQKWRQNVIVGASLKLVVPTGQYDPAKLINYGSNRWTFKPELGLSWRHGHWVVDAYGGGWFFTTNYAYFSNNAASPNVQSEAAIVEAETHFSYDVKPRLWASIDGNFWYGGRTSLNGVENASTLQATSRIGATCSIPLNKHQSVKFSYSDGDYARFGGNFNNVSVAWQYSWLGRPN